MKLEFDDYWHEHNAFYFRHSSWCRRRSLLPRRCFLTGRWLWFKQAMYGIRMITGPGNPIIERYWVDEGEFFLHKIRYGY